MTLFELTSSKCKVYDLRLLEADTCSFLAIVSLTHTQILCD